MSEKPLKAAGQVKREDHDDMILPILHPLTHTIGLRKKNIYKLENCYRK